MHSDALIVGAGPSGLSLAIALAQAGFSSTLIEQQAEAALAAPAPDGREIALTHPSVALLRRLGTWEHLAAHEIGLLREARVHNGPVGLNQPMRLSPGDMLCHKNTSHLGWIVPNHALRRAAWHVASQTPGVRIHSGARVQRVAVDAQRATVEYAAADGSVQQLHAPLLVAADSRLSATRRQLGIGAAMTDFGRTVIVCRMRHELPHKEVTHECFGYERTLAILPLPDDPHSGTPLCSAVVTTTADDAQALLALTPEAFATHVQTQFQQRLGVMQLVGERHAYPLVAVYARRFAGARCALLGDAAVGMHPVTAHGFNLGLAGVERLSTLLTQACARNPQADLGDAAVLADYARAQHRHAWPLYQGTNTIVRLFTDARPLPRLLRQAVLTGAQRLPPLKAAIVAQLTGKVPHQQALTNFPSR